MQFPNMFFVDVDKGPATQPLHPLFLGDALANRIGVYLYKDGEPFSPGGSAFGRAVLSGGETVLIQNGVVSENEIYIDLPSGVYSEQGPVKISVSWTDGTTTTTVLEGTGNVRLTETGTIIDPGTIISDVTALIQAIETARASIPPTYTGLLETIAPEFSATDNYTAGQYVWYDGVLYKFTADHDAGAWTGTDASSVVIGSDLVGIRNALTSVENINVIQSEQIGTLSGQIGIVQSDICSAVFSDARPYKAGELVMYAGVLHQFTANHATGAWTGTDAVPVSVADVLTQVDEALESKAEIDGSYEGLTAGSAEQLLATTGAEDKAPYTLRQTGGGVTVGDRAVEKIIGGTIAWNQLNANDGSTATVRGVTYTKGDNGVWAITGTATGSDRKTISAVSVSQNHVFAIFPGASDSALYGTSGSNVAAGKIALVILHGSDSSSQSFIGFGGAIIKKSSYTMTSLRAAQSATFVSGETGLTICPQLFDLTQMFGSAVADAVYAMDQATTGAGVAWFRAMFPESYYPYNAGELMSVQTSGKRVDGFNRWDEEWELGTIANSTGGPVSATDRIRSKRFFAVSPSTDYYCTHAAWVYFYDESKTFLSLDGDARQFTTPAAARFAKIALPATYGTTYKHDVCVNISDPTRNGTYKPYTLREYPLDSSLILRGLPKWDSVKGTMYYDGDEYTSDGRVKWKVMHLALNPAQASVKQTLTNVNYYRFTNIFGGHVPAYYNTTGYNGALCPVLPYKYNQEDAPHYYVEKAGVSMYLDKTQPEPETVVVEVLMSDFYATDAATPYTGAQWVEAGGTEAFIDAGTETGRVAVPVGHDTFYPTDLRSGLETLLETNLAHAESIAPVQGGTASANIAAGELLMQGGKLYKATQAIVAGAEIGSTNTTITTIAAQLAALEARIAALEN